MPFSLFAAPRPALPARRARFLSATEPVSFFLCNFSRLLYEFLSRKARMHFPLRDEVEFCQPNHWLLSDCFETPCNLTKLVRIRLVSFVCVSVALALSEVGFAQVVKDEAFLIDESRAPFVYEAKAEVPSPPEELLGFISSDYRHATDEFQQRALLAKFKPVIDKRISEAKSSKLFVIKVGYSLPKYDFDKQGFPTGVGESFFVYFGSTPYIVRFTNWEQLDFVPIEESRARSLQSMLRSNRQATLRVYGTLKDCREEPVNGSTKKVIYLEATKAILSIGTENKFAGQRIITSDANDSPQPASSKDGGYQSVTASDTLDHPNVEDDPQYAPLDLKLNEVYGKLRAKLPSTKRDELKKFEADFIDRRDRLRGNPAAFFALTEQQIAALEQMINFAP
jgi:uncharacterized protein YecT (DUF1311 family)